MRALCDCLTGKGQCFSHGCSKSRGCGAGGVRTRTWGKCKKDDKDDSQYECCYPSPKPTVAPTATPTPEPTKFPCAAVAVDPDACECGVEASAADENGCTALACRADCSGRVDVAAPAADANGGCSEGSAMSGFLQARTYQVLLRCCFYAAAKYRDASVRGYYTPVGLLTR